ncbi:MAG: hypothetical protein QJT81_18255 [Candidatus Thiothrix putei]|uniref:Glycosyltransferase RgtA/B/C/D-like domain-containing protein n=1 Tax=Candidatus Thiothrix putei TaxID=3080811 RepID=A0AA95KNY1_9GAMM|nr:MAG: hypothetical protein QJT81_18255 [Candidatus Thiothrix putei]
MMKVYLLWHHYKKTLTLALLLFIFSNIFVQGFADLAVAEFGASSSSLSSACKWDCGWYASIVNEGYFLEPKEHEAGNAANWAFFPLFPLLAIAVKNIFGISAGLALVITSKFFLLIAIFAFMLLVEKELGSKKKILAGFLVAFNPYIIYAHVGYTESLYFFLTSMAFVALKQHQWIMVGFLTGLLSATRVVGILFLFPYFFQLFSQFSLFRNNFSLLLTFLLGLLLIPVGLGGYMLYLHLHVGDALAFSHIQVAWGRSLSNPFTNLWFGLMEGGRSTYMAFFALFSLIMSGWLLIDKYYHYAIFLICVTLLPLATGLDSLPRYVMWQAPFLFGLVLVFDRFPLLKLLGGVYAAGIAGFMVMAWFSGRVFVI